MELRERKARLRRECAARRRRLDPDRAREAAERCAEILLAEPRVRGARRVALYAALPDELPTRGLFQALAGLGLPRLLPRVAAGGRLEFAAVEGWQELRPGRFGVAEPPPSAPATALGAGDVVLVPGLAFDRRGWRLGRGGGHYDRALAAAPQALAVGLALSGQLLDAVPHGSHDRPVDAIVTEDGWLWAEDGRGGG